MPEIQEPYDAQHQNHPLVGKQVRCTNVGGNHNITEGELYFCLDYEPRFGDRGGLVILNNRGIEATYHVFRFEEVV